MPVKNEGTYPRVSELSFEFGKTFLFEAVEMCSLALKPHLQDPYFTDLKFEFQLQNDRKILHNVNPNACWRGTGYPVRLNLEEIANMHLCDYCGGDTLVASTSSFPRKIVAASVIFLAITKDQGSIDPAALENPLRIPSLSESVSNLIDDLSILENSGYDLNPQEQVLIADMRTQLASLKLKLDLFSTSDLARMQLTRNVLNLEPGQELPQDANQERFMAIPKDHVDNFDWASRFSDGYTKAFKVETLESSKFYLFKAPFEVIKVMCELFVVPSNTSARAFPGDTEEVIETAIGVMTQHGNGPLSTTEGAFATARALED